MSYIQLAIKSVSAEGAALGDTIQAVEDVPIHHVISVTFQDLTPLLRHAQESLSFCSPRTQLPHASTLCQTPVVGPCSPIHTSVNGAQLLNHYT